MRFYQFPLLPISSGGSAQGVSRTLS